jgi:hypothetical protein
MMTSMQQPLLICKENHPVKAASLITRAAMISVLATTSAVVSLVSTPAFSATSTVTALSASEAKTLTFMREEEKLARDVYTNLYQLWRAEVFYNISLSEQQHMDTMKKMLDKYKLPDPALPTVGLFSDSGLQALYNTLLASGSKTLIDGLKVGATIEEVDMVDIQRAIDGTTHTDLKTAYQNLMEGSKSHLRAFVGELSKQGVTYTPQYISQELFNAIIGI